MTYHTTALSVDNVNDATKFCVLGHQVHAAMLYGKLCLVFEAKWTFQAHQCESIVTD